MTYARLSEDRQFAGSRMPNSRELNIDGTVGFVYEFDCELGNHYVLFAWFTGSRYKVKLVAPEYERSSPTGHATHLFSDATLCLEPSMAGCTSLSDAYSKSVLWANGHSLFLQTGRFPFSKNNL